MTSLDIDPALLLAPDEAPRRAEHAHAMDRDPLGFALCVDKGQRVCVPLQWSGRFRGLTDQERPEAVVTAVEQDCCVQAVSQCRSTRRYDDLGSVPWSARRGR